MQLRYDRIRAFDPDRPVFMNLGQGVANDRWKGRGAKLEDYPEYVRSCDIVSFDVYPIANLDLPKNEELLWFVAKGVRRLVKWGEGRSIVWNVIETTGIKDPQRKATPDQVRAEVWMSIISGSRGIVYFCHEFSPEVNSAALLGDEEMCAALAEINAEIERLAPVLNGADWEENAQRRVEHPRGGRSAGWRSKRRTALYLFVANLRGKGDHGALPTHGRSRGRDEARRGLGRCA